MTFWDFANENQFTGTVIILVLLLSIYSVGKSLAEAMRDGRGKKVGLSEMRVRAIANEELVRFITTLGATKKD